MGKNISIYVKDEDLGWFEDFEAASAGNLSEAIVAHLRPPANKEYSIKVCFLWDRKILDADILAGKEPRPWSHETRLTGVPPEGWVETLREWRGSTGSYYSNFLVLTYEGYALRMDEDRAPTWDEVLTHLKEQLKIREAYQAKLDAEERAKRARQVKIDAEKAEQEQAARARRNKDKAGLKAWLTRQNTDEVLLCLRREREGYEWLTDAAFAFHASLCSMLPSGFSEAGTSFEDCETLSAPGGADFANHDLLRAWGEKRLPGFSEISLQEARGHTVHLMRFFPFEGEEWVLCVTCPPSEQQEEA